MTIPLLALTLALLTAACGAGDDGAEAEIAPADVGDSAPAAPPRTEQQDQREIETLVRNFFEALVDGDADSVWALISSDLQNEVARSDVNESVALVAEAYDEPGFQFNRFITFESDGQRAQFQIDGFTTNAGARIGTEAQAAQSPPLKAVYEGDRWRLEPELSLLLLNQTQVDIGG